jgi:clan AA aspartic protease
MMVGKVFRRQALVPVTFRLPGRPDIAIEFVVDTGFTGSLALPLAAIAAMGLAYQYNTAANLADDSEVHLPLYAATILWDGAEQAVDVLATGRRPLLGTELLDGRKLDIEFRDDGPVNIGYL